jgi:hypothetical protein
MLGRRLLELAPSDDYRTNGTRRDTELPRELALSFQCRALRLPLKDCGMPLENCCDLLIR